MDTALWFYSDSQQSYGPVPSSQVAAMIQGGQLVGQHYIMPQGGTDWILVASSPFAGYLPQVAAPVPMIPAPPLQAQPRLPGQPYRPPQQRAAVPVPPSQPPQKPHFGLIAVVLLISAGVGAYFLLKPGTQPQTIAPAQAEAPAPPQNPTPLRGDYEYDRTWLIRSSVFGISKDDATRFLADQRLQSNPKEIIKALRGMVADKRATLIATPCMTSVVNPVWTTGDYWFQLNMRRCEALEMAAEYAVYNPKKNGDPRAKGTLPEWQVKNIQARRGETKFLGSFEESDKVGSAEPIRMIFASFD